MYVRRADPAQGSAWRGRGVVGAKARGGLDVRGIVACGRERDGILARLGEHVKFLRDAPADAAAIRLHRAELEAQAREDARVRIEHGAVALREARLIHVKRVGVLHDELARAHHAEARADLVAELGLDLIEIDRQLLVAAQLAARDVGDDLLVGRSVGELAIVPILEAQQFRAVLGPAAGFLPQFRRLDGRHA